MDTPLFLLQRETPVATGRHPALSVLGHEQAVDMLLSNDWDLDEPRVAHLCDCAVLWDGDCECDHEPLVTSSLIDWLWDTLSTSRPDWDTQAVIAANWRLFDGPRAELWHHALSNEYTQLSPSVMRLSRLGQVW